MWGEPLSPKLRVDLREDHRRVCELLNAFASTRCPLGALLAQHTARNSLSKVRTIASGALEEA
jgi:hypothetical protein